MGVSFWSPRLGVGALCHGVLPKFPPGVNAKERYRYVDTAVLDLISELEKLGIHRGELQVKVFGGADVLAVSPNSRHKPTVGRQNCVAVLAVPEVENLRTIASDLGGAKGRALRFDTESGEVLVRRLSKLSDLSVPQMEMRDE